MCLKLCLNTLMGTFVFLSYIFALDYDWLQTKSNPVSDSGMMELQA